MAADQRRRAKNKRVRLQRAGSRKEVHGTNAKKNRFLCAAELFDWSKGFVSQLKPSVTGLGGRTEMFDPNSSECSDLFRCYVTMSAYARGRAKDELGVNNSTMNVLQTNKHTICCCSPL